MANSNTTIESNINQSIGSMELLADMTVASGKAIESATKNLIKSFNDMDSVANSLQKSLTFAGKTMDSVYKAMGTNKLEVELNRARMETLRNLADIQKSIAELDEIERQAKLTKKELSEEDKDFINARRKEIEMAGELLSKEAQRLKNMDAEAYQHEQLMQSRKKFYDDARKQLLKNVTNIANSVVSVFTSSFSGAYDKLMSTYESTYGTTTSYNAYSKAEYNALYDSLQAFISQKGLTNTISITDIQEELVNILRGGLTGDLAAMVAKYSVLSHEGGISADFADESFLKMVKNWSDEGRDVESILSSIMTQSKGVIEQVGDSFGFANGQINTMMNSLYQLADVTNMSQAAIENSTAAMTAFSGVLGSTKVDVNGLYNRITEYAVKGIATGDKLSLLSFGGMTGADFNELISKQGMQGALNALMHNIYGYAQQKGGVGSKEFTAAVSDLFEIDASQVQSLFGKFKTEKEFTDAFQDAFEAANQTSEEKYLSQLKEYQTEQEKLNNTAENTLSEIAQLGQQSVITHTLIKQIIAILSSQALFGNEGILGTLENMGKLGKGGGEGLSSLGKLAPKLIGGGMAVAGIVGTGLNIGVNAYQYSQLTPEEKLNKAQKETKGFLGIGVDWSQVAKSAGSGALAGAGIGTAAGGNVLLGGVIGGAIGGGADIVAQLLQKHDYNVIAKSDLGMLSDSFSEFSSATSETTAAFNNYTNLMKSKSAMEERLAQYQAEEIDLTDEEVKLLEIQIKQQEKLIELEISKLGSAEKIESTYQTTSEQLKSSMAYTEFVDTFKGVVSGMGYSHATDFNKEAGNIIAALGGETKAKELIDLYSGKGIISKTGNVTNDIIGIYQALYGSGAGTNRWSGVETDMFRRGTVDATYSQQLQAQSDIISNVDVTSAYTNLNQLTDTLPFNAVQSALATYITQWKTQQTSLGLDDDYNAFINDNNSDDLLFGSMSSDQIAAYRKWLESNSKATDSDFKRYYAAGLSYVPYDGYSAILHKGERVLTNAQARIADVEARANGSSMTSSLESALVSQTNTIIQILTNIYSKMTGATTSTETTYDFKYNSTAIAPTSA